MRELRKSETAEFTMPVECPNCRCSIPWNRRLLKDYIGAKWRCGNCDSLLGFSRIRRVLIALSIALPVFFCAYQPFILSLLTHPIVSIVVYIMLVTVPFVFLERVRVIERHGSYCKSCGYDLHASKDRCPECGVNLALDRLTDTAPNCQAKSPSRTPR